jgi:methyl-accepting chemotaxis protein
MSTRVATAIAHGSSHEVAGILSAAVKEQLGGESPQLVMVFSSTQQPLAELGPAIAREFEGAVMLGCSSAGEFVAEGEKAGAASIFAVSGDFKVFAAMGTGLRTDIFAAVGSAVEALPQKVEGYDHQTAIILLDGLFGGGEEATLIAASMLGEGVPLAGGAAGDDLNMKQTFVAFGGRVENDALVIAKVFSKVPLGVGVAHGHVPLSPKGLRVTKAEGNVVYEIEGRRAWDVWVEETRERTKAAGIDPEALQGAEVIQYLGLYEGGLEVGEEYKVRVPLAKGENGALIFACGIPTDTVLHIMESDGDRQVQSAKKAAQRAKENLGGSRPAGAVVFDCTCRKLLLGANFGNAVTTIAKELAGPIAGFEAYGEIALNIGDLSGYHNTTTVVLAFPT